MKKEHAIKLLTKTIEYIEKGGNVDACLWFLVHTLEPILLNEEYELFEAIYFGD